AISLENSLLFEERSKAEATVGFLARVGEVLVGSLNYTSTLIRVAEVGLPFLADWCIVHVRGDGEFFRICTVYVDAAKDELLRRARDQLADSWAALRPLREVLETGQFVVLPDVTGEVLDRCDCDAEIIEFTKKLGTRTAMILPLKARGRTFGVLTF